MTTQGIIDTTKSPNFRLQAVPVPAIRLREGFWSSLQRGNVEQAIPRLLSLLEEHGGLDNFRRLAGKPVERRGPLFTDSDVYKWIEAVGFALQNDPNPELEATTDAIIADIAAAQEPDGYLNTYFIEDRLAERYQHLDYSHEMYCAGHLMQGAISYHRATGKDALLQVACKLADHLDREFGPGQRETNDGHPEIELALVELYRETGEQRYLDLAAALTARPQSLYGFAPIAERESLVGHAVRSAYICCGGADLAAESDAPGMLDNLKGLWRDLIEGKVYVTGGVGARYEGEAFGEPYELPNARAYAETCAQIGHFMWAWRMLMLTTDCGYADWMETILYNGFRSGVSLAGDEYFYMNPLAYDQPYQRSAWHGCTCCPPNVQRMLAQLTGYFMSVAPGEVWVHLYDACAAALTLPGGPQVKLSLDTRYPWEETVTIAIEVAEPTEFTLNLRIPAWAKGAVAMINGANMATGEAGKYLTLKRRWQTGDTVILSFPMPIKAVECNPRVAENREAVALQRGPLVYCVESTDHDGSVAELAVPTEGCTPFPAGWEAQWRADLLGGIVTIEGPGYIAVPSVEPLYRTADWPFETGYTSAHITAIPYYAWANRGVSSMRVWLRATSAWGEM
ncbi:MAG: beta-L-arabinofuranosidase domain-containing protein [Armatimonadota bacterium]